MIRQRAGLKPLCRQCGHPIERPVSRCPMCGTRTGYVEPLPVLTRRISDQAAVVVEVIEPTGLDEGADVVIAPPIERPRPALLPFETQDTQPETAQPPADEALVVRSVSLSGLMIGTLLVAACLGLGRLSTAAGVIAFLLLIPAYIRTLSAIYYYRQHQRELGAEDIAAVFGTSFVLSAMGLTAGGLVFLATTFLCGLILSFLPWSDPVGITTVIGSAAALVTVLLLIHRVWPVNQD